MQFFKPYCCYSVFCFFFLPWMKISVLSSQHIIQVLRLIGMCLSCIYTCVYLESIALVREAVLRYVVKGDGDPFEPPQLRITNSIVIRPLAPSYYSLVIMVIGLVGGKEVGQGRRDMGLTSPLWPAPWPWPGEGPGQQGPRRARGREAVFTPLWVAI